MIPLKIQLRNFLSYGSTPQTIEFSPHQLICLSGKNGHGKSALLDAITWAIWGQARKVAGATKPDQGLLRVGQSHMMVTLDFSFNNQTYRVRRELTNSEKKCFVTLDFGILDEHEKFKPLTGKTTRATQEKIEQVLNLDFESFSNSAFLRQGQSHEFSKKSPKERKEILGSILGLNRYEGVRKRALEKIRAATAEKSALLSLQEKEKIELETKEPLETEARATEKELTRCALEEKKRKEKLLQIETEKKSLLLEHKKRERLIYQQEDYEKAQKTAQEKLRATRAALRATRKKAGTLTDQTSLEAKKEDLEKQRTLQQKALQEKLVLQEQELQIKKALQDRAALIKEEIAATIAGKRLELEQVKFSIEAQKRIAAELSRDSAKLLKEQSDLKTVLATLEKECTTKEKALTATEKENQSFEKRKEYYHKYIALGNMLKREYDQLTEKKEICQPDQTASCPLCEQNLSAARRRFLQQKFEKEGLFLAYRIKKLTTLIQRLKKLLIEQHEKLAWAQKEQADISGLKSTHKEKFKQYEVIVESHKNIENNLKKSSQEHDVLTKKQLLLEKELHDLEDRVQKIVATDQEHGNLAQKLTKITSTLAKNTYRQELEMRIKQELDTILVQLKEIATVKDEIAEQEHRKTLILELCQELRQLKIAQAKNRHALQALDWIKQKEASLDEATLKEQESLRTITVQKETLLQQKGTLSARLEALEILTKRTAERQKILTETCEKIEEYTTIAQAFGKDGIQALLIEEAIPEVEEAANAILSRLTNNQAQIIIESLRDLKKGGTKETLDIKISDAVGMRPYELFSGGEAFRIDFALRIAISKLLARRAGTSLQTLIIDEGFGSQDEEGLQRIMNALYAIQDDFEKIIIVSHLSSMKSQFPVHLMIEKGPMGSSVSVIQQG